MLGLSLLAIVGLSILAFIVARTRAVAAAGGRLASLHSRPGYHGLHALLVVLMAGIGVFLALNLGASAYVSSQLNSEMEHFKACSLANLTSDLNAVCDHASFRLPIREFSRRLNRY